MLLPHHASEAFGAPFTRENLISHPAILPGLPMPWLALFLYAVGLVCGQIDWLFVFRAWFYVERYANELDAICGQTYRLNCAQSCHSLLLPNLTLIFYLVIGTIQEHPPITHR